jgi:prephenate dehydratase
VLETYDLLLEYRALVVAEVALQVDHCLLALPGARRDEIKRVLSHPQALAQCEAFLVREHLEPIPAYDTAGAAKQIQQEGRKDQAAIAGRRAAELYGLEILAERIQTVQENITRFFLITRRGPRRPKPPRIKRPRYGKKTSVVCAVANEPGALFRLLACFADAGVNLTKLESRPRRDPPWEYLFYLDLDGGRSEKPVAASLRAARHATRSCKCWAPTPVRSHRRHRQSAVARNAAPPPSRRPLAVNRKRRGGAGRPPERRRGTGPPHLPGLRRKKGISAERQRRFTPAELRPIQTQHAGPSSSPEGAPPSGACGGRRRRQQLAVVGASGGCAAVRRLRWSAPPPASCSEA